MKFDGVCVGVITKPFGVKGQVKIHTYTSSTKAITKFKRFFLYDGSELNIKFGGVDSNGNILANVDGCDTPEDAGKFRLKNIYVDRKDLPPIEEDEYYLEDLSGLEVFNKNGEKIGRTNAALDYGGGAFLDIKLIETGRVATLPFNSKSVLEVDIDGSKIVVDDGYILR